MAYHLRRLRVPWQVMLTAGIGRRDELGDLTQGRLPLNAKVVQHIAERLGLEPLELLRPLSSAEVQGWAFYRTSARHRLYVWQRAEASWQQAGLSQSLAARVMGLASYQVSHGLHEPGRGAVLGFEAATALAVALKLEVGAGFFIQNAGQGLPFDHGVDVGVQPLPESVIDELYAAARKDKSGVRKQGGRGEV